MRLSIFILICLLNSVSVYGQHSLASNNENTVYIGLHNSIDFLVQEYPCDNFTLEADSTTIEPTHDPCSYLLKPIVPGKIKIHIRDKKTNKIVSEFTFRVRLLPPPVMRLAGKKNGEISKTVMKPQRGLIAILEGFPIDARFEVLSFMVIVVRNKQVVFYHENTGAIFEPEVKNIFQSLQAEDKLVFVSAKYKAPDDRIGDLNCAEFSIID
jgi:hypothetical protein